ncbi:Lon protease family protein [Sulfurirhabdus autotrophica]|uniref:endopeptidase La n=1 Tax=Sulfurirhabdus autotrophica TaxID=1706046 RepID=A0A4R3YAL0_9PROT|nr:ATP-binding protein [Sulfurirhabdus autotrophica]TCV87413.1 lon-related putative ATP-dependent protease [Sulfurirhabdus autotrophica]
MSKHPPLPPQALFQRCNPDDFDFTTTADLNDLTEIIGQTRAFDAIKFGTSIRRDGYNLFVLGPPGMGKHTLVRQFLENKAHDESAPSDLCYVNNFQQPHKPKALLLPPGRGTSLRKDMQQLIDELRIAIPAAFESDEYRSKTETIQEELNERQESAFQILTEDAEKQSIAFLKTPGGFAFAPTHDDKVIEPEEYEKLPENEKERIEKLVDELQDRLQKVIRQIPQWRKEKREKIKKLNKEITLLAVGNLISDIRHCYTDFPSILAYLEEVQQDVIDNVDDFRKKEETPTAGTDSLNLENAFRRYQVNILVDHSEQKGAPIIYDDHPMYSNLVGRVEHIAQMGALVTDFMLIKPGSLHQANGGYLLVDVLKILAQPFGWEGLKRALNSREIRIESLGQMLSLVSTVSLEPEPVPLDLKIILFGDRLFYYLLYENDPEFSELFKVAADFEDSIDRNQETNNLYAQLIGSLTRKEKLIPFDRYAVARIIEQCSRVVGDSEKLSTHMQSLVDLLRESEYWAQQAGKKSVDASDIQQAIDTQIHRADRLRQNMYEQIIRGTVLIDTSGETVGQVNGLAVIELGNFAFAQPARITATTRLGEGELINIEREVELSGSIHSKGVLILSSFLAERFAKNHPLSLTATLTFEQSYGMIEGDSASVAELCALLSSLSNVPIKQSLAVTGSINQLGQVQTIGGVNEKIEGFFDICKARGLTGEQGVLIPATNVKHLMLRQDIVTAVSTGQFHVYSIENADQAIELLTGMPAGVSDAQGKLPPESINYLVATRLHELFSIRESTSRNKSSSPPRNKKYGRR